MDRSGSDADSDLLGPYGGWHVVNADSCRDPTTDTRVVTCRGGIECAPHRSLRCSGVECLRGGDKEIGLWHAAIESVRGHHSAILEQ